MSAQSAASYAWGQCTQFVAQTLDWVNGGLGNAADWLHNANAQGFAISSAPVIGSVAVWGANQGGALGAGHVAVVTGFQGNGNPIISEENWKGVGITDTRSLTSAQAAAVGGYILPPGSHAVTATQDLGPTGQQLADIAAAGLNGSATAPLTDATGKVIRGGKNLLEDAALLIPRYIMGSIWQIVSSGFQNVGVFVQRQAIPLAVGIGVLMVLFAGGQPSQSGQPTAGMAALAL